jgi:hypothetical protein
MSYNITEHDQKMPPWLVLTLAASFGLLAGPAIILGAALCLVLKHIGRTRLVWFLLAMFGIGGVWLMVTFVDYLRVYKMMMTALPHLHRWDWPTSMHFFWSYVLPLWTRSLLVTPICTALWELFLPSNVEEQLLDRDRREQAVRDRATVRARRAARRVPAQVNGQAVIGVVVKPPHNSHV